MSLVGVLLGLALLIWLTLRNWNLLLAAPLCALVVALTSKLALFPQWASAGGANWLGSYMEGFSGFVASWFFMFLLGALFGKMMEDSGAADSVAAALVKRFGMKRAALAIIIACAVLTYGGVSLFVVAFSVYPMALSLFRQADLPRRFIPATLGFGSVTFTMTSAGSPEIQNWIPIPYLNTTPYAGWQVSIVVALAMAGFGYWWLQRMIAADVARGERFISRDDDPKDSTLGELPKPIFGVIPLLIVLGVAFALHESLKQSALVLALGGGLLATAALNWKFLRKPGQALSDGAIGALIAIANTAAVVGFGAVAKSTDGFQEAVTALTSLPGSPLISAAIAVTLIAGLTGSASGGQAIALPLLAPHYMASGVDPDALHRVVALSSGALDSLPHNGYVVTTIRAICKETHGRAYGPMAAMTVAVPATGTALAILLFML
ncbi:GntP family permease [Permianibacter sp. IMCC34836]|nr:GntP family permease [Permianibacter fluminis]